MRHRGSCCPIENGTQNTIDYTLKENNWANELQSSNSALKRALAKEVDAMGGLIAKAADRAAIHIKKLNSSKERLYRQQGHKQTESFIKKRYRK